LPLYDFWQGFSGNDSSLAGSAAKVAALYFLIISQPEAPPLSPLRLITALFSTLYQRNDSFLFLHRPQSCVATMACFLLIRMMIP
jgi:hypothetical protein